MPIILIAEDDPATLLLHETYISGLAELIKCENGEEAWNSICAGYGVDLIITDHEMPRLTGRDLLLRLQSGAEQMRDVPVIMVTASITREELGDIHVDYFFRKPVQVDALRQAVSQLLG